MIDQPTPRKLKVDLNELELAFENSSWEIAYFLDKETGSVLMVQESTFRDLENIYDEYDEEEEEDSFNLQQALDELDLEDWERQVLLEADQVRAYLDERYLRVPMADSHEGFRDMELFIETVQNSALKSRLSQSLRGHSPFRRFKDTLQGFPKENERWFDFKADQMKQRTKTWLADEGIEIE